MQIGCTKKILDILDVTVCDQIEENDLFCWSANLLTIKRRKAVVVVNDSSRFGFVLYGLKAKDFSQLKTLIEKGIRRCLQNKNIKAEVIDQYFAQAEKTVFTKTRGRVFVARLNRACGVIEFMGDQMDPSDLYQTYVSKAMNSDLIKTSKTIDYAHPYELLIQDFQKVYGEKIIATEAANLLIRLDLGAYVATRRLLVPMEVTLKELHQIIQIAFDWRDSHLHDFNLFDEQGKCILTTISEFEMDVEPRLDCPMALEKEVRIDAAIRDAKKIIYTYDYGDDWRHEITVQGIVSDYDKNYPICLMAEGNRPPEDVGGIPGYEDYLEIIDHPDHPEYEDTKSWAASQGYRDCNMDIVNRRLRYVLNR